MSSVGSCLSEMRVKRGVSLEEVARATRVASRYLAALEANDFSQLPPPVFTRGFIRAVCQMLDEPPGEALALYEQRQGGSETPIGVAPRPPAEPGPTRTEGRGQSAVFVSFVLLVALGAALFAVAIALQVGREPAPERRAETVAPPIATSISPDAPSPSSPPARTLPRQAEAPVTSNIPRPNEGQPLPPSVPSASPQIVTPPAFTVAPVPVMPESVASPYRLVAKTTELTWLRVRTEDGHLTEENIPAGQVREWVSDRPFVLTVGNAGGVTLELNGHALPPLGASGAVIRDFVLPGERP